MVMIFALLETRVVERDPAWRSGGTTLQGHSTQQFVTAEPIKVDPSYSAETCGKVIQPRSQGLFPIWSAGGEKTLASAGHVPPYTLKSWV